MLRRLLQLKRLFLFPGDILIDSQRTLIESQRTLIDDLRVRTQLDGNKIDILEKENRELVQKLVVSELKAHAEIEGCDFESED